MLFLHGLGGDAFTTWRHGGDDSSSWPHWLGQEFPEVGVWSLGYAASPTKWTRPLGWFSDSHRDAGHTMALPDRARQVLDLMVQNGFGERPLFFICHSLGGLVAKQILRMSSDSVDARAKKVFTNTRAVLFLATPHAGAALASLADAFGAIFGTTVTMEDLRAHDAHLADLFNWYRHHAPETATYYETRSVKGFTIVNRTSSQSGVGADPIGLEEDHKSIAKPRDRDAQVCGAARDLLLNVVLAPAPAPPLAKVEGAPVQRVPHELPPAAEEFFGRRGELELLIERLRARKNTAVVGPAGLGKTALAARALVEVVGDTPAALASSLFPDGVVFLDLYTFRGEAEPAWDTLANRLAGSGFLQGSLARDRAAEACRGRDLLVVLEGGEEADGRDGRTNIDELLKVLTTQNRWLLLTRLSTQAAPAESVQLREALNPEDAGRLLNTLTKGRITASLRERALTLLEGHPLALTWAGNLLARDDDDPEHLVGEWEAAGLPPLNDPTQAAHTLEWLFNRSVRGLDGTAKRVMTAAALLAHAPFPLAAVSEVLDDSGLGGEQAGREALKVLAQTGLLRRSKEADHWQFAHVLSYRFARQETGSDPAVRVRLGRWLHGYVEKALAGGSASGGPLSLTRALEHLAALLRADDDQSLWIPLANAALYDFANRLKDLGRLTLVKLAVGSVASWLDGFPADKAQEPEWFRVRSVVLEKVGDVQRAQGDLAGALASYGKSLEVRRRLAEADPSNAGWQRDLSVSQERIGNVQRAQGDLAGARASYGKSLEVTRRLAEADPSNAGWQRGLSVSYIKVGDVQSAQGDLAGARASYGKSLEVRRRLAEADPANAGWQRDLSVSHNKLGDVQSAQGDLAGALASYGKSLELRRRLAEADPSNAGWQRDLSLSLTRIAQVHERNGNHSEALRLAEESLAIDERLAALDRSNVMWQKDVAVSRALVRRLSGPSQPV